MATGAAKWIWANSRASNGSLLVLLAIADECGGREFTEMSVAQLMAKCRLSDKGVRRSVEALEALGELSVEPRPGGISRYALTLTPVKMTGPTPVKMTGPPVDPGQNDRTPTPVKMTGPPEEPQVNGTPVILTGVEISDILLTVTGSSLEQVKETPAKPPSLPDRPDVERLCARLADRIAANGSKRPVIGKKWRDAARLLIDKDGRTEEQVAACIDWSQNDEFWLVNIQSMPTLREKYDRLRLDAIRKMKAQKRNSRQPDETDQQEALEIARQLDAMEAM